MSELHVVWPDVGAKRACSVHTWDRITEIRQLGHPLVIVSAFALSFLRDSQCLQRQLHVCSKMERVTDARGATLPKVTRPGSGRLVWNSGLLMAHGGPVAPHKSFSTAALPRPPGTFVKVRRRYWLSPLGGGGRKLLGSTGRRPGCCSTSHSAQDAPQ